MKYNRRDFIKTGGMVMLGSLAVPSFLEGCAGSTADKAAGISFALNHFGLSESDMKKVLNAALEKGGDYADLFFEHSYRNNIGLQDGAVNRASSNIDFGMGVRVLSGDQTGYAYVENISLAEMLTAARTAARIANGAAGKGPAKLTEEPIINNYYGVQTPWDEIAVNQKTPYLQKLNDQIFALDKRVHKVMASLGDTTSHIFFCNSEGQTYFDYRPMVTLGAVCIMEDNGKIENSYASRAFRMGVEFLTDEIIAEVSKYPAATVILTGGEPSLWIDDALVDRLHEAGKYVCIETNGTRPLPASIDWVTCSPKQGARLAITRMDEVKVVYEGQDISIYERLSAEHFFLQPCSCYNTALTVDCVMRHPKWRLSLQTHKLIDIR